MSVSRFGELSEAELTNLLENRDSLSTKNVIKGAVNVLQKFCEEKNENLPSQSTTNRELDGLLTKFYPAARTADGKLYSKKLMLSIRYGLQRHFDKLLTVDIVNNDDFSGANKMFQSMLIKLKKEGKCKVQHKEPLNKDDLLKLYTSFDFDTPAGLQNKVFVDFMIYFCNRGRENLREIKKSDFIIDENSEYIEMRDMATKNHKGDNIQEDSGSQGGRIYRTGNHLCPYFTFTRYLSLLHPENEPFFQRPKARPERDLWYDNSALGKNQLGDKMKKLSAEAKLSRNYTNHCLRATSITVLDGFEARHVMTVSGHQSEGSIRSYARTSDDQRKKMALTLSEALCGMPANCDQVTGPRHSDSAAVDDDMCNLDLLTSSQESIIQRELINITETTELAMSTTNTNQIMDLQSGPKPVHVPFLNRTMELQHSNSNYGAPVYSFYNSTVHIHHH